MCVCVCVCVCVKEGVRCEISELTVRSCWMFICMHIYISIDMYVLFLFLIDSYVCTYLRILMYACMYVYMYLVYATLEPPKMAQFDWFAISRSQTRDIVC